MNMSMQMALSMSGSYASSVQQQNMMSRWQQQQQSMSSLRQSVSSGDLSSAQQAYAALAQTQGQHQLNPNSPMAQLGQALQSGNLSAAKQQLSQWGSKNPTTSQVPASTNLSATNQALTNTIAQSLQAAGGGSSSTPSTPSAQAAAAIHNFMQNLLAATSAQSTNSTSTSANPKSAAEPGNSAPRKSVRSP